MRRIYFRFITLLLILGMLSASGCGYLLYPERQGQKKGKLDPVVILLDGAGLFLGILPGVVAFAVDITNGTIYLSEGESSALDKHLSQQDVQQWKPLNAHDSEGTISSESISQVLSDELGYELTSTAIEYYALDQNERRVVPVSL